MEWKIIGCKRSSSVVQPTMRILTLSDQGFRKNPTTDSDVIRPLIPGLSDQKYSMVGMLVGLSERRSAP